MATSRVEMRDVRIRSAKDADRARLIPLINAAFAVEHFLEGTRTDEERLSAAMAQGEILMAEDGEGRLLGCVYVEGLDAHGYIGMLAVDPAQQGRGLSRILMQTAEERLRSSGLDSVEIVVLSLRPDLPPLYRKYGYEVTGTKEFQPTRTLKPGYTVHGIVMKKRLQGGETH